MLSASRTNWKELPKMQFAKKKKKKKKKKSQYYGIQLIHIIIFSLEWIGQYKKEINNIYSLTHYEVMKFCTQLFNHDN
jgi:ribosomal protein S25